VGLGSIWGRPGDSLGDVLVLARFGAGCGGFGDVVDMFQE